MRQLTYETGLEHALARTAAGEFELLSGGEVGMSLPEDAAEVLARTHPYQLDAVPVLGPSQADIDMLNALDQNMSVLLEHGQTILFGPEGTFGWL